ncbi:hypothetical protein C808_02589 [Lachnospiraceae bacterium M18-1]|nr:hypothetical protein C808_02589 [Lachnospiraceae bacterium M18-1]
MIESNVKQRAQEILARLTPEQKLAQIVGMFGGGQIPAELLNRFQNGLGEISFIPGTSKKEENLERSIKEQEILNNNIGIPAIRHNEALTGQMTADSTVFPSAIALGATWDTEVVQEMADIIREQMVAEGTRQALSPVMDVARDPRWGRVGETYGEDPTLCAAMSVAFVKGLQSDNLAMGVMATGKHFLGYGNGEGGLNMAANPIPPRELREIYAKPFQAAITEGNLGAMMNSYGAIDGELIIGSKNILTGLLREEMGFDGVVVSDYMSIDKMVDLKLSETPEEAGVRALKAGLDCELPMPYGYKDKLLELVTKDQEAQKALDRAALKMLEAKIKLGLLDGPAGRKEWIDSAYDREKTGKCSLRAAHESIVLLKNNGILPLSKEVKKIALIGSHADSMRLLFGCYTYPAAFERDVTGAMADMPGMQAMSKPDQKNPYQMPYLQGSTVRGTSTYVEEQLKAHYEGKTLTILEAIRAKCPNAELRYVKGCDVAGNDRSGFTEAFAVARWADVVLLAVGGKYGWGTSCTTGEGIDCDDIGLTGIQDELAEAIAEVNPSCVLIHMDTKPVSSEILCEKYAAVIENWFPGDTGGQALADVLFGDYNPAGRLPITAARNAGQVPIYHSQRKGSGYRPIGMTIAKYVEGSTEPLFPFGYGLSYTKFEYSDLSVTPEVPADGIVEVCCRIKNCGERDGEEVVQLYVTDELSSMLRPAQELAGFCRVALKAGETKKVRFTMWANQFAFLDEDMHWLVEAGKMTVRVGNSSADTQLTGEFTIRDTAFIDGKNRGFYAGSSVS